MPPNHSHTAGASSANNAESLSYKAGFGNHFESEAVPGALPRGQNSPQITPFSLYAEQMSGTAFNAPRATNQRTWMYRLDPSVKHGRHEPRAHARLQSDFSASSATAAATDQLRWLPLPIPALPRVVDFVDGLWTMCGAGSAELKDGVAIHLYAFNTSMSSNRRTFANADGDLLIVPQLGALLIRTELGRLAVEPGQVAVIPRNITFAVDIAVESGCADGCRGYVLESFCGAHFAPPERGLIGANGLAELRDFEYPTAWFEDVQGEFTTTLKSLGQLYDRARTHSPFDVVAWHGNYCPFRYDLSHFHPVNSVSVDHPDPSIFTVLTVASSEAGTAAVDFAIFPPRWMAAEHTFRPPYFHRNCMAEFMGLIHGGYDAKVGFVAGGASLHNIGTAHGPDAASYSKAIEMDTTQPSKFTGGTAFMFETRLALRLSSFAADKSSEIFDAEYARCWDGLPRATLPSALQ